MAPSASGDATTDHLRSVLLAESVLNFPNNTLSQKYCTKTFHGCEENALYTKVKNQFKKAVRLKPKASRPESRKFFCRNIIFLKQRVKT